MHKNSLDCVVLKELVLGKVHGSESRIRLSDFLHCGEREVSVEYKEQRTLAIPPSALDTNGGKAIVSKLRCGGERNFEPYVWYRVRSDVLETRVREHYGATRLP